MSTRKHEHESFFLIICGLNFHKFLTCRTNFAQQITLFFVKDIFFFFFYYQFLFPFILIITIFKKKKKKNFLIFFLHVRNVFFMFIYHIIYNISLHFDKVSFIKKKID